MQLTRALELLVLGLSAMSVAEAAFVEVNVIGRDGVEVQRRQTDDAANTSTPSSSASPAQTSSTPPASSSSSSNPAPASTSSHTQAPATSSTPTNSPSTSTPPPKTSTPSSSSVTVASSTADNNAQSSSSNPADSSSSAQPTTMTSVLTITTTAPDGRQMTLTSSMVTTATPGLADSANNSGSSSGMSPQTRNTVIGVVVGVGGAIILAGLALVAWRIWGRRKHAEENDGLMDYPLSGTAEKLPDSAGGGTGSGSMVGRTPFQSTLESYHAPTQVNTAANF